MPSPAPDAEAQDAVVYDFRRPQKFSREHARALQIVGETLSRRLSTAVSTAVRTVTQVSLVGVGQLTCDEFVSALSNPNYLVLVSMPPLVGTALLHIPLPLMSSAIDRLLGGPGLGNSVVRPLTEIELALARSLVEKMLRELVVAFESLAPIEPEIVGQESNPQFAQIAPPSDLVVLVTMEMRLGQGEAASQSGEITLCIPFSSLQHALDDSTGVLSRVELSSSEVASVRQALTDGVCSAPLSVSVRFNDVSLLSSDIVELQPGDVLALRHRVDEPLHVSIDGTSWFSAKPGRRSKRLACVIVDGPHKEHAQ